MGTNRRFVLTIPAPEGSGMKVKDITEALEQTAKNIRSGFSGLSAGNVRRPEDYEAVGRYEFVEDPDEPVPSEATLVAQRWQKLKQAVHFQDVLAQKNGNISRIQAIGEIQDIMSLIEEGKI